MSSSSKHIESVILEGAFVRLEPLSLDHHTGLCEIGLDPALWRWSTTLIRTPDDMRNYIETALMWQQEGTAMPFAIIEKSSAAIVGSTRYANIDIVNRRLEIGWTWVATPWQRTPVNTAAKLLLLTHAFEKLGYMRVEFKTDSLNQQSRNALLRIGAKEEGVFRNHMVSQGGRVRHTVYYSIIDSEWPEVKKRLEEMLNRREDKATDSHERSTN